MEQNMEEKKVDVTKKTKNKNTGIIVFLILVLICMTGYIIYDKTMSDKCDVKENEKTEEERFKKLEYLDIYSDQIQKLYNNIRLLLTLIPTFEHLTPNHHIALHLLLLL